jgi:CHAT domain-containing protein/tetratricopeptide (TPR) repeat protein
MRRHSKRRSVVALLILLATPFAFAGLGSGSWRLIGTAAAQSDPLVRETNRLIALSNARQHDQVAAQAPSLMARVRARDGENGELFRKLLEILPQSYRNLGRFAEAEQLYKYSTALAINRLGPDHPFIAIYLHNMATFYWEFAHNAEAEALYHRAFEIEEKNHGNPNLDPNLLPEAVSGLGLVYFSMGRYAEAETLLKRALAMREAALGRDDNFVAVHLTNLGALYLRVGRHSDAASLLERAEAIELKSFGRDQRAQFAGSYQGRLASTLGQLGMAYVQMDRPADAEAAFRRAVAVAEKRQGPPDIALPSALRGLADVHYSQRRFTEAEPLLRRALAITEKMFPDHPWNGEVLLTLANVKRGLGQYAEAKPLYERTVAIREKYLGPDHLEFAEVLRDLAELHLASGDVNEALASSRRAVDIAAATMSRTAGGSGVEAASLRSYFEVGLRVLSHATPAGAPRPEITDEAFRIAQWANQPAAAAALNQMAARIGSGSDALAKLVREQQDVAGELRGIDKALVEELAKATVQRGTTASDGLRQRAKELEQKLAGVNVRLNAEFPDYAALTNPKPLALREVQALLGADEALVFLLTGEKESHVFALTRDNVTWRPIAVGSEGLTQSVAAFRRGLDVGAVNRGLGRLECSEGDAQQRGLSRIECGEAVAHACAQSNPDARGLARFDCILKAAHVECNEDEAAQRGLGRKQCADALTKDCSGARGLARTECDALVAGRPDLFDLARAHELYATLLGPVEGLIKDKARLIVVPTGALTALPFHLLVTQKPAAGAPQLGDQITTGTFAAYREAAWLLKRHAVTVLPSIGGLKALRVSPHQQAAKPMIGFGDPVFDPNEPAGDLAQRAASRGVNTRGYTEFWQGVGFDRAKLTQLPRLWDTAVELQRVAQSLGAPASDIHLRADASEATVKRAPLADYRVVYFATHGLVAGDIAGLAEPSLALTIPTQPTADDNGLLTASEVAQLKLNADWVVLSACNTIAGDKPGAEALSGLARAFFYAGARALLVSHWSVDSAAATRLTTTTFNYLKADPTLGRAEALRRAMLAYLNDTANPRNAYPAFWAPFEVVGEGAAR